MGCGFYGGYVGYGFVAQQLMVVNSNFSHFFANTVVRLRWIDFYKGRLKGL